MLDVEQTIHERYLVVRLLGKGGLSYVYEVQDLQLPRRWALKELRPPSGLKPDDLSNIRQQFQAEVALLSRLSHPRLPLVADSFQAGGRDYLVMELIEGSTLDDLIRTRETPFEEAQVMTWALQMVDILAYLHGQSPPIIYRDVKPQNIIIDPALGVRFIDFGIARLFNPVKEQDTIFMGTPGFAPPEQFRQKQTDPRSDIYSLGATLHYLLTRQDPGATPFAFEPVGLLNPTVSPLLQQVVQKCVEIRPENRFQNVGDIARVLRGELALAEVTQAPVLVLEPRELAAAGILPTPVTLSLTVRAAVGASPGGHWQSEHPGLSIQPERFERLPQPFQVTIDGRAFPRGETVSTALVLSTGAAKIQLPVRVQVRPTWLRGLSPGMASLLLFALPALLALGWLEAPAEWSPGAVTIVSAVLAALAAACIPWREWDLVVFFLWIGLAAMLALGGAPVDRLVLGDLALVPHLGSQLFDVLALSIGTGALLVRLIASFSVRQRQEMSLVPRVAFFLFPVLLFFVAPLRPMGAGLVNANRSAFLGMAALLSLPFLLISTWLLHQEQRFIGMSRPRSWARGLLAVAGAAALALVLGRPVGMLDARAAQARQALLPPADQDPRHLVKRLLMDTDHVLVSATTQAYLGDLFRGLVAAERGVADPKAYETALRDAPASPRVRAQIVFLLHQARVRAFQPSVLPIPLDLSQGALSADRIQYYAGSGTYDRPAGLFYFETASGCLPFHDDQEIWAVMQFQHLLDLELTDQPGARDQLEVVARLVAPGSGPIFQALQEEIRARRSVYQQSGPLRRNLMRWLLDRHDDMAAWNHVGSELLDLPVEDRVHFFISLFTRLSDADHKALWDLFTGRLGENDPETQVYRLAWLELQGRFEEARQQLDRLPTGNPIWACPSALRLVRDTGVDTRNWSQVAAVSQRLARPGAQDELLWAVALDMLGRPQEAGPHYQHYLDQADAGENPDRLRLVRGHLQGAPLPSLVIDHAPLGEVWRIIGEGIPEDLLPRIPLAYGEPAGPPKTSENIRLEQVYQKDTQGYHARYYRIHFIRPGAGWRFWIESQGPSAARLFPAQLEDRLPFLLNGAWIQEDAGDRDDLPTGWYVEGNAAIYPKFGFRSHETFESNGGPVGFGLKPPSSIDDLRRLYLPPAPPTPKR